jgi:hypothetical protein
MNTYHPDITGDKRYGIGQRQFEAETGLRNGDIVEYQFGIDGQLEKAKIEFDYVGAGFFVASMTNKNLYKSLHTEIGYGLFIL